MFSLNIIIFCFHLYIYFFVWRLHSFPSLSTFSQPHFLNFFLKHSDKNDLLRVFVPPVLHTKFTLRIKRLNSHAFYK